MRRWNGWGEEDFDYPLPGIATSFLAERLGEGDTAADASLERILERVPDSALPDHPLVDKTTITRLMHSRGQSLPDWIALKSGKIGRFPDGEEKYGYAREHAEQEVERRLKEFADKSSGVVANMAAKAQEFGATAATKANDAATVVGDKIGSMASAIRENAPHDGAVANVATAVVGGLESASSYLKEKKFDHVAKDGTALVRTYPVQSLLIGIGLGYLLARRPR